MKKFHVLFREKILVKGKYAGDCSLRLRQIRTLAIDFCLWVTLKDDFLKK